MASSTGEVLVVNWVTRRLISTVRQPFQADRQASCRHGNSPPHLDGENLEVVGRNAVNSTYCSASEFPKPTSPLRISKCLVPSTRRLSASPSCACPVPRRRTGLGGAVHVGMDRAVKSTYQPFGTAPLAKISVGKCRCRAKVTPRRSSGETAFLLQHACPNNNNAC